MSFNQFHKKQRIPSSIEEVWNFISNPVNLKAITPPSLRLRISSSLTSTAIYKGMIISYNVRPLPGMNSLWVTEITQVKEGSYFVDEQRIGPYALWHHEHWLTPIKGGVLMTDRISYVPPLGKIGNLMTRMIIRPKLDKIFYYRFQALEQIFGKWAD